MRKILLNVVLSSIATLLLMSVIAWATNTTIGVTAGSGSLANLISFASTHVISEVGVCDATTENQCGSVSAGGALKVDNSAVTQPVSGTVAATQSGTWNVTNISGTVSLPTGAATSANQQSITTWAGSTLGAISNYGTSPGAVLVPAVNANVTNANANGQTTASGSSPVVLASNQSVADPCTFQAKSSAPISTSGATNVQLVAGVSAKKVYICSLALVIASAASFNVIEGTGAACTTANEAAVIGSTTASAGLAFAANGGMTYGNGNATVGVTATAANGICILTNTSSAFGGVITYLQQ